RPSYGGGGGGGGFRGNDRGDRPSYGGGGSGFRGNDRGDRPSYGNRDGGNRDGAGGGGGGFRGNDRGDRPSYGNRDGGFRGNDGGHRSDRPSYGNRDGGGGGGFRGNDGGHRSDRPSYGNRDGGHRDGAGGGGGGFRGNDGGHRSDRPSYGNRDGGHRDGAGGGGFPKAAQAGFDGFRPRDKKPDDDHPKNEDGQDGAANSTDTPVLSDASDAASLAPESLESSPKGGDASVEADATPTQSPHSEPGQETARGDRSDRSDRGDHRDSGAQSDNADRDRRDSGDRSYHDRPDYRDRDRRDSGDRSYRDRPDYSDRREGGGYRDRPDYRDRRDGDYRDHGDHYDDRNAESDDNRPSQPGMRLARRIALSSKYSRRLAEELIQQGDVAIGQRTVYNVATNVTVRMPVKVKGKLLPPPDVPRLWAFHKPAGVITTRHDPEGRPTIYDELPHFAQNLMTVGRLDWNTSGLLLLSNNGALKRYLELPENAFERRYYARVFNTNGKSPDWKAIKQQLAEGVTHEGVQYGEITMQPPVVMKPSAAKPTAIRRAQATKTTPPPDTDDQARNQWIELALKEGKNREIRTVLEHVFGLPVNRLIRVAYGPFVLDTLPSGRVVPIEPQYIEEQLGEAYYEMID
ncbi:MAG: hypothetical protein K0U36_02690, partial [Alphaproteobacteria bacterium]|nr:hypothetical protein [Alphaproteobacteria bacterium]